MTSLKPVSNRTLSSQVEEHLRAYILSGAVGPSDKFTENALSGQLGVSRGPLREAILKLIEEGLIIKETYKGLRVRQTSLEELQELKSMRLALETFAFKEAWTRRTAADFAEIDRRCSALVEAVRVDGKQVALIDLEIAFHSWVFEVAGHSLLKSTWKGLSPLFSLYLSLHQRQFGINQDFIERAIDYCTCAKGDDLEAMLIKVSDHLNLGLNKVVSRFPDGSIDVLNLQEGK